MWKSSRETESIVESYNDLDKLERLFGLRMFWAGSTYTPDYSADEKWVNILGLTNEGEKIVKELKPIQQKFSASDFYMALFLKFYHHNLFFSWTASDIVAITSLFEEELLHGKILLSYRWGRLLYDKFNNMRAFDRTDHLPPNDAINFLKDTPIGVYQCGFLVSGPLGLLESLEPRHYPPSQSLPLWHCSDTGCMASHNVVLLPAQNIPVLKAYVQIRGYLGKSCGRPSEWTSPLRWLHREGKWPRQRTYSDVPAIIGDCIVGSERAKLLETVIQTSHGKYIRETIKKPPRKKKLAEGSAEEVVNRLTTEGQLQLLMLIPDIELVSIIDDLVDQKKIHIALGEKRVSKTKPPIRYGDVSSILSVLGIRPVQRTSLVSLISMIWRAYEKTNLLSELEWRIRSDGGRVLRDALVSFVRSKGAKESVKELLLSTGIVAQIACDELRIPLQQVSSGDQKSVNKLLWKLGFDPLQFDDSIQRFRNRLKEFEQTVHGLTPIDSEDDREKIRSCGVNLFVSLEDFLDRLITFNVWFLASDHFLETGFTFHLNNARRLVPTILGGSLESDTNGVEIKWSPDGNNTLGTLMRYLQESLKWIEKLLDRERHELLRPACDLPHFEDDPACPFPFLHKSLWADSDVIQLRHYLDGYSKIVKLLNNAESPFVRNGLDHHKPPSEFPSRDKLLACAGTLTRALDFADIGNYFPKLYWLYNRNENRDHFAEYEFRDYDDRQIVIQAPPMVSGLPTVTYNYPVLLPPGHLLGISNSLIVFKVEESSEYSNYWKGYPRRRTLPPESSPIYEPEEISSNYIDDEPM